MGFKEFSYPSHNGQKISSIANENSRDWLGVPLFEWRN